MIDSSEVYRQSQGRGASKVGMVVVLYEAIVADLARAQAALRENNVERRTREIQHALTVLGVLQGTLNFEKGGRPAEELNRFYTVMRAQIMEAQVRSSKPMLDSVIGYLNEICDAWRQVDTELRRETTDRGCQQSLASAGWIA